MRWLSILIAFILCGFPSMAQNGMIERIALNIPDSQTNTTTQIAAYIDNHFKNDEEKVRAIYAWVTSNIKYDRNNVHRIILDEDQEQRVTYALKGRRGVCENFAAIFNDLCIKSGIPSFYIEGCTKQNGSVDRGGHVWCAALVNNKWAFYDPTWDAGFWNGDSYLIGTGANYFQISPKDFILSHLPFDPMFQFLNDPVSYKEFDGHSKPTNNPNSYFNYKDSLGIYFNSDSLSRYVSALHRIANFDWPSSKIDAKLKQLQLEIELIYQDRDMAAYNSAIADYNTGIDMLNEFIIYRNNQFQPVKKSSEVQHLFDNILKKIVSANQNLSDLNKSEATLTLNTGGLQEKLNELAQYAKEQNSYYRNYLSLAK
ncbi:MAG TPA: transglutaminase domain-containing protein [Hanamia sp.]